MWGKPKQPKTTQEIKSDLFDAALSVALMKFRAGKYTVAETIVLIKDLIKKCITL